MSLAASDFDKAHSLNKQTSYPNEEAVYQQRKRFVCGQTDHEHFWSYCPPGVIWKGCPDVFRCYICTEPMP